MHLINTILVVIGMFQDLVTGGDPTVPSGFPELWPLARLLSQIYDLLP